MTPPSRPAPKVSTLTRAYVHSRLSTQTRLLATNEAVRIANSELSRSVNSFVSSAPSRVLRPSSRHSSTSSSSFPSAVHYRCFTSSSSYEMPPDMTFAPFVPSAAYTMSTLISASASMLATPKPPIRASGSGSTARCGASLPPTRRLLPVQHDLTTPRARARAARLRANEAAELHEDLAALITTPVSTFFHLRVSAELNASTPFRPPCPPLFICSPWADLPIIGTMGSSAPLVRRRENGVRRSRRHVLACTVCTARGCIGSRSRSRARYKATTAIGAPFFLDLHVGVDARRWHRPPKAKEAETAAVGNGAGVGTGSYIEDTLVT